MAELQSFLLTCTIDSKTKVDPVECKQLWKLQNQRQNGSAVEGKSIWFC